MRDQLEGLMERVEVDITSNPDTVAIRKVRVLVTDRGPALTCTCTLSIVHCQPLYFRPCLSFPLFCT